MNYTIAASSNKLLVQPIKLRDIFKLTNSQSKALPKAVRKSCLYDQLHTWIGWLEKLKAKRNYYAIALLCFKTHLKPSLKNSECSSLTLIGADMKKDHKDLGERLSNSINIYSSGCSISRKSNRIKKVSHASSVLVRSSDRECQDAINQQLAKTIRLIRLELDLNRQTFAYLVGVDFFDILELEHGVCNQTKTERLIKIIENKLLLLISLRSSSKQEHITL